MGTLMYLVTWKSCMLPAMPENSVDDVAEVDDDEQDHDDEGDAEAELFADEVAEAFAGDDAHAGAHLLHDDEGEGDGDHRPEEGVAELGAGLRSR